MLLLLLALVGAPPEVRAGQSGYLQAAHKGLDVLLSKNVSHAQRVSEIDDDHDRWRAIQQGYAFEAEHNTRVTVVRVQGAFAQVRIAERTRSNEGPPVGTTGWVPRDQVSPSRTPRRYTR